MEQIKAIFFDLDGTLIDPKEGITKSVQYALNHFGISVDHLDKLCPFIGPPLKYSFMEYYGFSEEKVTLAIEKFREYFEHHGIYEHQPYDGVGDFLKAAVASEKKVYLATSKPEVFAKQILDFYGWTPYFTFIGGADLSETRVEKTDVLEYIMKEMKMSLSQMDPLKEMVMIGDRKYDIIGAKNMGIKSIGVSYGYGTRKELEDANADQIVDDLSQLAKMLFISI